VCVHLHLYIYMSYVRAHESQCERSSVYALSVMVCVIIRCTLISIHVLTIVCDH